MLKTIFLTAMIGAIAFPPLFGVVQRIRARARLNDLRANLTQHLTDNKDSVEAFRDVPRVYLKTDSPDAKPESIWTICIQIDSRDIPKWIQLNQIIMDSILRFPERVNEHSLWANVENCVGPILLGELTMLKTIFLTAMIGAIAFPPLFGVVQRIRARARLNDLRANLTQHLTDNKDSVEAFRDVPRVYLKTDSPDAKPESIWTFWKPINCTFLTVSACRDTEAALFITNPPNWFSSSPTVRIHYRISEPDEELTGWRKSLVELTSRVLVEDLGFLEPEITTETYTLSEHKAAMSLLRSPTKEEWDAGWYKDVTYIDGEGKECIMRAFIDRSGGWHGDD